MKAKPEDVVHVKGTVVDNHYGLAGEVAVVLGRHEVVEKAIRLPAFVAESDIVHVERTPLKVGDNVVAATGERGCIIAIDATSPARAWIREKGLNVIVFLNDLERA